MDSDVKRRLQTFVDELQGIAEQKQLPFQLGFITTTSTQPIHDDAVWKVAESFVQPVLAKQKDELHPKGQKTPPTVKCRSFLHFRNLKHRNLSRLILRQSVPMLCGFHRSLTTSSMVSTGRSGQCV
jgi:hypothetical protein